MTDKEKITTYIDKLLEKYPRNYYLLTVAEFIDSLQEEPISGVWHTMDEEPPQDSNICLLWPRDNIITIGKLNGLKDFRYVSKWAYAESILNLKEEPVSGNIDFEHELYKAFGQVKDFTLCMQIAKRFYDMGKNSKYSQEPINKCLDEEIKRCIYDAFFDLDGIAIQGTSLYASVEDMVGIARHFAEWQKERIIVKACKWFNDNACNYFGHMPAYPFIDDLRKAMEK